MLLLNHSLFTIINSSNKKSIINCHDFSWLCVFPCLNFIKNNLSWSGLKQLKVEVGLTLCASKLILSVSFYVLIWISPGYKRLHNQLVYHLIAFFLFQIIIFKAIPYSSEMAYFQVIDYLNFMTILVKYFPFHSHSIFQKKVQIFSGNCQIWRSWVACLNLLKNLFKLRLFLSLLWMV